MPAIWVDLDSLGKNFGILRMRSPGGVVFPVLKADAYGHGAKIVAEFLERITKPTECPFFCVARFGEALEVLRSQRTRDVLILSDRLSSENYKNLDPKLAERIIWVVNDFTDLKDFLPMKLKLRLHLNFNTGMNRLGLEPELVEQKEFWETLSQLNRAGHQFEGILSHLSDGEEDPVVFSSQQVTVFERVVNRLQVDWPARMPSDFPKWIHIENSGGNFWAVGKKFSNASRPGLHLYGVISKLSSEFKDLGLSPVLEVRAPLRKILKLKKGDRLGYNRTYECTRESFIGVVGLGYADGVARRFSKSDSPQVGFWIYGQRAPLVGVISMDLCHVDLTDHPQIEKLLDRPQGVFAEWLGSHQTAWDLAHVLGTIPYEILTSLGHRLPRIPAIKNKTP